INRRMRCMVASSPALRQAKVLTREIQYACEVRQVVRMGMTNLSREDLAVTIPLRSDFCFTHIRTENLNRHFAAPLAHGYRFALWPVLFRLRKLPLPW